MVTRGGVDDDVISNTLNLSTRQLLRIAKQLETFPDESIRQAIERLEETAERQTETETDRDRETAIDTNR